MAQTWNVSNHDWKLMKQNSSLMPHKFTVQDMDNKIRMAKYAVRGAVPARAGELAQQLKAGEKLPFDRLVFCNIGNPHAVGQKPITFYRQVAAAVTDPSLLSAGIYPDDVKKRATEYLAATNGAGSGAYTDSSGLLLVRQQVANFLLCRDGYPAEPKDIYLTTGVSEGVKRAITALIKDERCGMLIPRPQYPLYSAALTMVGGRIVYYDMYEEKGWKTSQEELNQAAADAFTDGTKLRAITVINPGNPVGAVLDREDVVMLINFATEQKLVILADEVYQENVYKEGKKFHSFKKVLRELQKDDPETYKDTQLISFHSTSKGIIGECGQRGGYMEYVGALEDLLAGKSEEELGLKPPQLNAFLLLIHLDHAVRQGKTYLSKIFNAENKSRRKELEIGEFYRGLKRIHVIDALDLSEAKLCEALWELDPGFDGRVYLPILDRALKVLASTGVYSRKAPPTEEEYGPFAYGETSPVRSIDIPMEADSINNFRKAFKCFRDQQNELLTFHSNLKHLGGR